MNKKALAVFITAVVMSGLLVAWVYAGTVIDTIGDKSTGKPLTAAEFNTLKNDYILTPINGNINTANIADNGVGTSELANDSVTPAKIDEDSEDTYVFGDISVASITVSGSGGIGDRGSVSIDTMTVSTMTCISSATYTNFVATGTIEGQWQLVYDITTTSNTDTIGVSGLTGDTDLVYKIIVFGINNGGAGTIYYCQPNAYSTNAPYNNQSLFISSATITGGQARTGNGLILGEAGTAGETFLAEALLYCHADGVYWKCNTERGTTKTTLAMDGSRIVTGVGSSDIEVTSVVLTSDQADAYGSGTHIMLFRRNPGRNLIGID